ncbi:thioesterase family protein [Mechercharimyces sp. CAU 1602]|uniref:acyl-CoA thioesterase n=1 Tax=Mechercharimyces sp. CAU 1602 TaxID=2973933 RepID=UPI00216393CD|nr:acyl-CoA thioesterase [Mechercharimyces sp. CAU 1602]MCS1351947.1 acyl-CoA thioesterase [Mechercharimyces sp. CAU 1602]
MESEIKIIVRPTEIDAMGHVNNAKYLEYMEWGREDWYNQVGLPFDLFTEMGIGTVTVHIAINYRKEALLNQHLTIRTHAVKAGRTSFVLQHIIENEAGERVADAEVTSVTIDLEARKGVPLPEQLRQLFT